MTVDDKVERLHCWVLKCKIPLAMVKMRVIIIIIIIFHNYSLILRENLLYYI